MIFLAAAMTTRVKPGNNHYRFEVLTALWCRYRSIAIAPPDSEQGGKVADQHDLVDWFTLALFGPHPEVKEVRKWLKRCQTWLQEEPRNMGPVGPVQGPANLKEDLSVEVQEVRRSSVSQE